MSQSIKRDWVPIIVTVITGLIGTSLLAYIYNSITAFSEKPYVQILITPDHKDAHKASIKMSNNGGAAATNLKLMIVSPERIVNYNNFSTENLSLTRVNATVLEGNMHRFVQGDGSFAQILLTIAAKPNVNYTTDFNAYATFDQGSSIGALSLKPKFSVSQIFYYVAVYSVGIVVYYFTTKWVNKYFRGKRRRKILCEYELQMKKLRETVGTGKIDNSLAYLYRLRDKVQYSSYYNGLETADHQKLIERLKREIEGLKNRHMLGDQPSTTSSTTRSENK